MMLTKLRALASLYRELGPRWMIYRAAYIFRLRTGIIRLQMPMGEWGDYQKHVGAGSPRPDLQIPKELPENIPWNKQQAIDEATRLLNGELKYFSHQFIQTSFPPNWHADYVTLSRDSGEGSLPAHASSSVFGSANASLRPPLSAMKHWSQLSDDSSTDIKFIWEPNRFAFVYILVRAYAASQDEKYSEAFWTLIEDWVGHNPPNAGPNWMDGQEIALRLMAWTFGFQQFSNSPSSTPDRKAKFILLIAAQAERIYKNRSFAINTHGNHSITEAFGLWMTGLLFPELKNADKYLSFGRMSLEREARAQIFPDGAYSMYSLNYHRFILHIYLYAIRLSEIYQLPFTDQLITSVTKSIEYLSQLIDPATGQMPVYGSNDGALVLPLNNCDFTDYRPLLQLGWYITKGERLFEPGQWDEDIYWICGELLTAKSAKPAKPALSKAKVEKINLSDLSVLRGESFPDGGVHFLRNTNSKAIIRCTDFSSRPSHADQLHVDLWIHGQNIAIDAGTYLYSGEGHWRNGLARTSVHNTVTVDNKDQMTMLSRFTWTNWSKGKVLKHEKDIWQGEHDGYMPVSHKRTVMALENDRWLVIDNLNANESHHYALHWLLSDGEYGIQKLASGYGLLLQPAKTDSKLSDSKINVQLGLLEGNSDFSIVRADLNSTRGWRSRYYGHKEPAVSVMLEADVPQVTFWTLFGLEDDVAEVAGNVLRVNSIEINLNPTDN